MPRNVKTKWTSTEKNPEEAQLKARWNEEVESRKRAVSEEANDSKRRKDSMAPLIEAAGASEKELDKRSREAEKRAKAAAKEAARTLATPPVDYAKLHKQDIALAKEIAKKSEGRNPNPSWYGYIWSSAYGGWWGSWNGESEEVPNATITAGADRFDPRAQSWGEGWYDSDFSEIHAYLAFRFNSPSWGHLHVYAYPWAHGYYSLYSDDDWYNSVYARAEFDTWLDLHQNFWRGRQYTRRFTLAGQELHPTRSGRIDNRYGHAYFTDVGEGDTVTIRVGARLYCRAKASGSHSILNFQAGSANYITVPYVYWYLHH